MRGCNIFFEEILSVKIMKVKLIDSQGVGCCFVAEVNL